MDFEKLPEVCYGVHEGTGMVVILKRGEHGYYHSRYDSRDVEKSRWIAEEGNLVLGVTKAQAAAMSVGAMLGWSVPGANPENYDIEGNLKR